MLNMALIARSAILHGANPLSGPIIPSLRNLSWMHWALLAFMSLAGAVLAYPFVHQTKIQPKPGPISVKADPLPLDGGNPARQHLGPLTFLGAWHLTSDSPAFGGISAMTVHDGWIDTVADNGTLIRFGRPPAMTRAFAAPLPVRPVDAGKDYAWDSEAMIHDPATGRSWVGFELMHEVCRYSADFARAESCRSWRAIRHWPATESVEAMVRLPDGRFLIFAEAAPSPDGLGTEVLLYDGDASDGSSGQPVSLSYRPPVGYKATDAAYIGHGRLLLLNRRVTLAEGFTAILTVVDMPPLKDGAVLRARPIARFAPPVLADNFEAMAVEKRSGQSILWIASDDNHLMIQRTLLLKFALPPELSLP